MYIILSCFTNVFYLFECQVAVGSTTLTRDGRKVFNSLKFTEGGLKLMSAMSIAKFERFFRVAAGLDVDKSDLKRYSDFVNQKIYDLLLRGQATAKANGRDIIEPFDVPITKGLQERIHDFKWKKLRQISAALIVAASECTGVTYVPLHRCFKYSCTKRVAR
jgi:uncharacterized protein DUF1931